MRPQEKKRKIKCQEKEKVKISKNENGLKIVIDEQTVERVNKFKYLSVWTVDYK